MKSNKEMMSAGKKRMGMVQPGGKSYEEGSPEEEASESPEEAKAEGDTQNQGGVGEEAQAIVDSIGDNHDLCMAVYGLLKEKYDNEKEDTTKDTETPAKPAAEMDSEGMPG